MVTTCLAPRKYIKERIDNWLKSHVLPTMSTNIVEAVSMTPLSLTSDILSQEVYNSKVLPVDLKELCLLNTVAVSTLKQVDSIRKWISEASKAKSTSYPSTTCTQWYSNIEEPEVIQHIINKSLESSVMLTQQELYAISPDIC